MLPLEILTTRHIYFILFTPIVAVWLMLKVVQFYLLVPFFVLGGEGANTPSQPAHGYIWRPRHHQLRPLGGWWSCPQHSKRSIFVKQTLEQIEKCPSSSGSWLPQCGGSSKNARTTWPFSKSPFEILQQLSSKLQGCRHEAQKKVAKLPRLNPSMLAATVPRSSRASTFQAAPPYAADLLARSS